MTVVAINVRTNIMNPSFNQVSLPGGASGPEVSNSSSEAEGGPILTGDAREVIDIPDAWEEW